MTAMTNNSLFVCWWTNISGQTDYY